MRRPGKRQGWSIGICTSGSSLSSARTLSAPQICLCGALLLPLAIIPRCRGFCGFQRLSGARYKHSRVQQFMSSKTYSLRTADLLSIAHQFKHKHYRSRYVVTKGKFVCCSQCCSVYRERFALLDQWEVLSDGINKSDRFLRCDSCGLSIPIAVSVSLVRR